MGHFLGPKWRPTYGNVQKSSEMMLIDLYVFMYVYKDCKMMLIDLGRDGRSPLQLRDVRNI